MLSSILFILLYTLALSFSHELKIELIAIKSCSFAFSGKSFPVSFLYSSLALFINSTFDIFPFNSSFNEKNFSFSTPITISENICINLKYRSYTNSSLSNIFTILSAVLSFIPRFNIVSIIPGIDTGAPDLTDTRRGFSPSNLFPVNFSSLSICSNTSSFNSSLISFPFS